MTRQIYPSVNARYISTDMLTVLAAASLFYVIDGDTVSRDHITYRIANIEAPELRHPGCDAERRLAGVARRRLDVLLKSGRVEIRVGDPASGRVLDRYGRTLAVLSVSGQDIGDILVTEGLARPWTGRKKSWCGSEG